VRRGLLLAIGLGILAQATTARADWEVRRNSDRALVEQAARALAARPEDAALAARLVRLAGKNGAVELRARFERPARPSNARYADLAAYATLLLALGANEDAAAAFARAAAVQPESAMLAGRARALERAGRRDDAIAAYDEARARASAPSDRRRLLEAELALLTPTLLERELELRRALADLEPLSEDAAARVADVLERLGRPAEAADLLETRGAAAGGRWFERGLRVAELRDAAGDGARATDTLAALLAHLPRADAERRREAWTRAVAVARHRDALPSLAATLAHDPGPVEWDVLGQVRDELGDLEGALEAERRAAGARPSPELGRRIAALLDRLGRDDEAVAVYEELARRAADDPTPALELVERELRRGRRALGEASFDRAAARFAGSPSAMIRLAELAGRWGEDDRARAAWERVLRLAPRDEQGLLGLGETQFAAGKRELALKTWRGLRGREAGVAGRLHLAEVLLEHELLTEALAEAQAARERAPKQAQVHRLLAQILERQHQTEAAVREWEEALALSPGVAEASERHEARTRILALLTHSSRARLDERVRALEERVRLAPGDRETALFLAEAQQRLGNQLGAIATLRAILERDAAAPATGETPVLVRPATHDGLDDGDVEVTFALVRLLRAAGQTEEAVRRLEEIARRVPARAREAHVQIADVELARHDEAVALAHAEAAARLGAGDGQALSRIATIQERAGDDERALETYRRAFDSDADATAGFALAASFERRGDVATSAAILRRIVETATDDEVIIEAGRRALDAEELLGRLPELERFVARGLFSGARAPAVRRVLVEVLRRLLPTLYRAAPTDAQARETRARVAQHGLRPILELLIEAEAPPDPAIVELLGLLGNRDAAPVLARLAAPGTDPAAGGAGVDRSARGHAADEARLAAVIALGRLADERGHDVLEKLATAPEGNLRAAAVWALGRSGSAGDAALFSHALRDARADVVGFACLGLGRARSAQAAGALASVAADVARPVPVRRAALAGLGLSSDPAATTTLLAIARSGDDLLARSALLALGARRDRRALPTLLEDALLARAPVGAAALRALDLWASGAAPPDEALGIDGMRVDLDAVIAGFEPPASGADTATLWRDDPRLVAGLLASALRDAPARRLAALAALDSRDDGPGLGPLVATGAAPLSAPTSSAVVAVGDALRDALASNLDDDDAAVRAAALRVLVKCGDARATVRRVALAAAAGPEEREAAVAVARRWNVASPSDARALANALTSTLAAAEATAVARDRAGEPSAARTADRTADRSWEARLGVVDALAAMGSFGAAGLQRALGDESVLVRAAATAALSSSSPAHSARP
jgi:tetratricopeptide (TPR) repeat protein